MPYNPNGSPLPKLPSVWPGRLVITADNFPVGSDIVKIKSLAVMMVFFKAAGSELKFSEELTAVKASTPAAIPEDNNDDEEEKEEDEANDDDDDDIVEGQIEIIDKAKKYAATNETEILNILAIASEGIKATDASMINVSNLFKGAKLPVYAANKLYDYLQAIDSAKLPVLDSADPWLLYHTTRQSTSTLAQKMLSEASAVATKLLSEQDIAAIESASPQVLNHGISNKGVAITHAYLTANHYEFGNWYQGEKAKNAVLPGMYSYWLDVFTKFNKLVGNKSATDHVATVDELSDHVSEYGYKTKTSAVQRNPMSATHRT
jgi:hypothetical protein